MNLTFSNVSGLPEEELGILNRLAQVWQTKLTRNQIRYTYYSYKNRLKDFGISIPDTLRDVDTVIGWPAKAVNSLASRSRFDGFTFADGDSPDLRDIVKRNKLKMVYKQAATSELISSCSFLTVSAGTGDEPKAIISAYSALFAAAEWDRRKKRIRHGLTVIDTKKSPTSDDEEPIWVNLYTDTDTWEIKREESGWTSRRVPHEMGRPMMEPLVFRPSLDRPFGQSRITRAVMSITDSAVREALRSEVGAEFYTSPQKYILGVDDDFLEGKSEWDAYIGSIMALTKDEDGDTPRVGMFSQGTMQPHTEYMRSLAARFSGETSIPISELGVVHDNPASAEAIYAAKESLVCEAEDMNEINGAALCEVAKMAIAISKGIPLADLDENDLSIEAKFKNPAMPSIVSQADAIVKVITALPWVAESSVALEEFGFSDEQIRRLQTDKQKAEANAMIAQQIQADESSAKEATMYEIASILKSYRAGSISRNNAIALFSRVGIGEQEALAYLNDARDIEQTATEATKKGLGNGDDTQGAAR